MFIATTPNQDLFRSVRSETSDRAESFTWTSRSYGAPGSCGQRQAINMSPLPGRSQREAVLHFKVEFAIELTWSAI